MDRDSVGGVEPGVAALGRSGACMRASSKPYRRNGGGIFAACPFVLRTSQRVAIQKFKKGRGAEEIRELVSGKEH